MNSFVHRQWLSKRLLIADKIVHDFGWEAEADAEIILCCALNALAATIWPGTGFDRKRFTQLLVEFAPASFVIQTVSVCALIWNLGDKHKEIAHKLIDHFFHSRSDYSGQSSFEYGEEGSGLYAGILLEIIWPDEIDTNEAQIHRIAPDLPIKTIRGASYANIIYSHLRNGLVHEYEVSGHVTGSGWHGNNDRVSYINSLIMPDEKKVADTAYNSGVTLDEARDALSRSQRRLYFPYSFIRKMAEETAASVFDYWDSVTDFSRPLPPLWWIDG